MSFVPNDAKADKCAGCGKTAYPNERISACSANWHKTCLKCGSCGLILNLKTVESFQNKPYCKVHKPTVSHTQVTDSVAQKNATAAPKATKTQGIRKDERMTFAPGAASPIRGGAPGRGPAPGGRGPAPGGAARGPAPAGARGPAPSSGAARGPAPSSGAPKAAPKPVSSGAPKVGGVGADKCPTCGKTVYSTEAVRACGVSWHKTCLKCLECGLVLNLKTVESFQNKPYCKVHKPNPKATQVTDSVSSVNAKNAPKAARAAGGVKRDARMTFAPGSMHNIGSAEVVNPGGVSDNNAQSRIAPTRTYEPPSAAGAASTHYEEASYDEPSHGGYDEPPSHGGYDEPPSHGGYDEPSHGGYDEPPSHGGYDEPPSHGGYDEPEHGGYEEQGGYDQGGYEEQGGYEDQGGYDQGDQGGYEEGGYEEHHQGGEEDWS